eukprot:8710938-Alexandrium_andersonii.AAC.1
MATSKCACMSICTPSFNDARIPTAQQQMGDPHGLNTSRQRVSSLSPRQRRTTRGCRHRSRAGAVRLSRSEHFRNPH